MHVHAMHENHVIGRDVGGAGVSVVLGSREGWVVVVTGWCVCLDIEYCVANNYITKLLVD